MDYNPKFGPNAQTPEQRAYVLQQLQVTHPSLKKQATTYARQLYDRYIGGEISWMEVRQALDTTTG
jgi:hypothetical protein